MPLTPKPPQRAIQLTLFRPARNVPSWETVPPEVQQQVLRLMAHLLRDHVARWHGERLRREDRDE